MKSRVYAPVSLWLKRLRWLPKLGVETLLFNCSQPEVIGAAIDAARENLRAFGGEDSHRRVCQCLPPQPKGATANDRVWTRLREDLDPPVYLQWRPIGRSAAPAIQVGAAGLGRSILRCWPQKLG